MLNVTIAPPRRHRSLTVFPLIAPDAPELPYSLMSDALAGGSLRITEVGAGTVPSLLATNTGDRTILALDGEQLVGARQNRTTSRSILLPAGKKTTIPVSCMEQGRWHFESDQFVPTHFNSPSTVRRQAKDVEAGFASEGAPVPVDALAMAQGNVWNAIAEHSSKLRTRSDTGALDELYEMRSEDLDAWAGEFPSSPDQVGLLVFLGERALGLDVIGCGRLYARLHDRLLRGYVMDALGTGGRSRALKVERAQSYLDRVTAARRVESPTVGLGSYAVLSGEVVGGELTEDAHTVHLSAFPHRARPRPGGQNSLADEPIAPPSRRRRRTG